MFLVTDKKPHTVGAFLLLMLSAFMYAASLMMSCMWWCALFFWVPLCVSVSWHRGGFWWGFAWGVVAYGFLYSFTVPVLYYYGHGFLRICAYPCLVAYLAFWSGLLLQAVSCMPKVWRLVCLPLLLCGYFYFCNHAVFIGLGVVQGNPLFSPVLPLVPEIAEHSLSHVGRLQRRVRMCDPLEHARLMTYEMIALVQENSDLRVIVAPESYFPYPLNEYPDVVSMWRENVLSGGITLCCGAYRSENGVLYNSLYVITDSHVEWYDKRDLCYVTENVSWWGALLGLEALFLRSDVVFARGVARCKPVHIPGLGDFVPYLCSELLLARGLCDEYPEQPIICLANDSWFFDGYMPRLMALQACSRALTHKRPVLYVSYNYFLYIEGCPPSPGPI